MDDILDALRSGNLIAWAVLVVLAVVAIKLLGKTGKTFVLLLIGVGCVLLLMIGFPEVAESIAAFVRGSWLGK